LAASRVWHWHATSGAAELQIAIPIGWVANPIDILALNSMKSTSFSIAAALLVGAGLSVVASAATIRTDSGFTTSTLPNSDDGSTGAINIGFDVNFFGSIYKSLYVNNNGNVTFTGPLSIFTPFSLLLATTPIIAPFFADVDTRKSSAVTFGNSIIDGRNAFGVNWVDVGPFTIDPSNTARNSFQLVLIDRSDIRVGDFDIEFNYGNIGWDTGDGSEDHPARVGWSNGSNSSFELDGSGIKGSFLNGGSNSLLIGSPVGITVRNEPKAPPTNPVPDGGSTALLLGIALLGFEGARRRLAKS
jgi:hypothetical protein